MCLCVCVVRSVGVLVMICSRVAPLYFLDSPRNETNVHIGFVESISYIVHYTYCWLTKKRCRRLILKKKIQINALYENLGHSSLDHIYCAHYAFCIFIWRFFPLLFSLKAMQSMYDSLLLCSTAMQHHSGKITLMNPVPW